MYHNLKVKIISKLLILRRWETPTSHPCLWPVLRAFGPSIPQSMLTGCTAKTQNHSTLATTTPNRTQNRSQFGWNCLTDLRLRLMSGLRIHPQFVANLEWLKSRFSGWAWACVFSLKFPPKPTTGVVGSHPSSVTSFSLSLSYSLFLSQRWRHSAADRVRWRLTRCRWRTVAPSLPIPPSLFRGSQAWG